MSRAPSARAQPGLWLEVFIVINLAFLALDVFIAHQANAFARTVEWLPVAFSLLAALLIAPGVFSAAYRGRTRALCLVVGAAAITIGIVGMLFHLRDSFFARHTLRSLVYTAPFVAPLAYAGLGLLLVLQRLELPGSFVWSRWVALLACGGFAGNLALSLLDHAQDGFFRRIEWIPVASAAYATSFLLWVVVSPSDARLRRSAAIVMGVQALVGVAGFCLHGIAALTRPGELMQHLIYGAPVFAPLLFTNLAILAALALWGLSTTDLLE